MPDRHSSDGTARVAHRTAPHRAKLNADLSQHSEMPLEVGVGAEAHFGVDPRHKGLNSKCRAAGAPSTKCPIGMKMEPKFLHHPHEAHKYVEARPARHKLGHSVGSGLAHRSSKVELKVEHED